jgi:hypothetical protein
MMIREGGKIVKRGGEWMLGILQLLGESAIWALDVLFLPRPGAGAETMGESVQFSPAGRATRSFSPLDDIGPVPDELRKDPFPGGTVPWCIQEAEREQDRARKVTIWKIAVIVSWSVTLVAALRALGML